MVLGIVAEYNPFHNGHLYHILKSKELTNDDYVVTIVSGNFTQRGEPSLVDKWSKAEMALANGSDLVIELPTLYATSSAENFADGAIKILNSLKIIDHISFGAEHPKLNELNIIANILNEETKQFKTILQEELKKGNSFPKARENAIVEFTQNENLRNIMHEPNNILGIEYLKALKKYKSSIQPVLVKRKDSGHLSLDYTGTISSATYIRNLVKKGAIKDLKNPLTPSSYTIVTEEIQKGHFVKDFYEFEKIILYKLRISPISYIKNLPDVSEGLENLLKEASLSCNTIDELISIVSSKRYTETRIKRILLYVLLDITQKDIEISKKVVPYIRVLGFTEKGKTLLTKITKKNTSLNIITSVKKFIESNNNKNLQIMINKDILSTNVYTLAYPYDSKCNLDFTKRIITKK